MENLAETKKETENINKSENGSKIVNLCEDMNFHEHDENSYNRMKTVYDQKTSIPRATKNLNVLLLGLCYL